MRKKGGRKKNRDTQRTMVFAEQGESTYGQIIRAYGSGRFDIACADSINRIGKLRGKFIRKVWIRANDIVLVSLRGEDGKCDIIHKYHDYEIKQLKESNLIPENFQEVENTTADIEFDTI